MASTRVNNIVKASITAIGISLLVLVSPVPTKGQASDKILRRLAAHSTIRRELSTGQQHSYELSLTLRQYVHAIVNQKGITIVVTLYAPGGRELAAINCSLDGPTPISLVSNAAGIYRLDVSTLESRPIVGSYELKIEEMRPAIWEDGRRISAEGLGTAAERLRSGGTAQAGRKAIALYRRALSDWIAIGDTRQQARALKAIGEILHPMGETAKALDYYNRALRLARNVKDLYTEGEVLSSLGYLLIHLGENGRALETCQEALRLGRYVNNRRGEAQALINTGEVYSFTGDVPKALDYFEKGQAVWNEVGDRRGQAQTLLYFGYAYSDLSESSKAFESYGAALALWRSIGDVRGQALTLTGLGHLHSRLGDKQEALEAYDQAKQLMQETGNPVEEARLLAGMAFVYRELGDIESALDYHKRAISLFRAASYRPGEAASLVSLGGIYFTMSKYKEALSYLRQALPVITSLNDRILESYAFKNLAAVYNSLGDSDMALEYYNKAVLLYQAASDRRGEAFALNGIANIDDARGEKQRALSAHNRALMLNRAAGDRFGEVSTLFNIARIERDLGQLAQARVHINEATNKIELLRAGVSSQELRASFVAAVRQNYELSVDLLMRSHSRNPSEGLAALALQTVERARARSLMEMLAEARTDIRQGVDKRLYERERSLLRLLNDKEDAYSRLLTSKHAEEQTASGMKEIERIRTDYQQVQGMIRWASPRYAALMQPQPISLIEIQKQLLDQDTMLLEYSLGDDRSYLWAVTPDSLSSFELPKRSEIEQAARRVYDLLNANNKAIIGETEPRRQTRLAAAAVDYWKAAAELSRMVLGPVISQLGTKRLLIVADGALQYIPFGALPAPLSQGQGAGSQPSEPREAQRAASRSQPLIVEHEIVSSPSASTLAVLRRELEGRKPAPKAVAVLADPVFSRDDPRVKFGAARAPLSTLPESSTRDFERAIRETRISRRRGGAVARLPFSRAEAAAIKQAAPDGAVLEAVDFEASRATATSAELSHYRVVHFATHGLLDSEHPELSGIVLSLVDHQGKHQNGFLRLHDVYNLNLPAELVVLSACQTGLGKDVKGEGLMGLTRGFMYAGAARVMASLWKVDDLATAELMKRFYVKMLGKGLRPAAALRDAQVEMLNQKRWQSPFYWAAFTLQGEWK